MFRTKLEVQVDAHLRWRGYKEEHGGVSGHDAPFLDDLNVFYAYFE